MVRNKNFIVKICGLNDYETAINIFKLKPTMIGLVFVPGSIRCVELETAIKITTAARNLGILVVGVFQNQVFEYVTGILKSIILDYVQMHGVEDILYCKKLNSPVIKTIIPANHSIEEIKTLMNKYSEIVDYFLIDRNVQGSGKKVDFKIVEKLAKDYPIILAGGLNSANIECAVTSAGKGLSGVDTSSGVENSPGEKDLKSVESFILNARRAYESI